MLKEKTVLNKEYFERLDKLVDLEQRKNIIDREITFIPLTSDIMFKSVMRKNPDIFSSFLIKTMDIDISVDDNVLYLRDKELIKGNIKEKGKTFDFIVNIGKNLLIDVEVNRSQYSVVKTRNDFYLERLDIMQVEVNDSYDKIKDKKLYQLNLNANLNEEKINKRLLVEYDVTNKEVYDDRKRKYIINLVNYKNMFYNNREKMTKEEIFMAGLMSNNYVELYEIMSLVLPNNSLESFMESVIDMTKNWEFIS